MKLAKISSPVIALVAVTILSATLWASPARAAFFFDFGNTAGQPLANVLDGPDGNSRLYSSTVGGKTLNLRVSAFSIASNTIRNGFLGVYSNGGLGVTNRNEGTGASPKHAIDNKDGIDFILLQFDRTVRFNQGWFTSIPGSGVDGDTDSSIRYGKVAGPWNATPLLDNKPASALSALLPATYNVAGTAASGWHNLAPPPPTARGNWWVVLALDPPTKIDKYIDSFKFRKLEVTAIATPEPATWAVMLAGFGTIGGALRRKSRLARRTRRTTPA